MLTLLFLVISSTSQLMMVCISKDIWGHTHTVCCLGGVVVLCLLTLSQFSTYLTKLPCPSPLALSSLVTIGRNFHIRACMWYHPGNSSLRYSYQHAPLLSQVGTLSECVCFIFMPCSRCCLETNFKWLLT